MSVKLNCRLNSGSGSGDMYLLVPNSAFAGQEPKQLRLPVLEVRRVSGARRNGGFEEWAVRVDTAGFSRPGWHREPVGIVFSSIRGHGHGRSWTSLGIEGVTIQLRESDIDGVYTVVATTTTGR